MNPTHHPPTHSTAQGHLLMELAIVLALIAIVIGPLMQLSKSQQTLQTEQNRMGSSKVIMEAIEAFVLTHHRLPCPSDTPNGTESRKNGICTNTSTTSTNPSNWVPSQTLGLPPQEEWKLTIATLSSAGAPAQDALTADNPFQHISPQQLAEVIYAPPTESCKKPETVGASVICESSKPVGSGPLPAIHLCQHIPSVIAPGLKEYGCGNLPLYSASAVLVISPGPQHDPRSSLRNLNQDRTHQFFIHPDLQNLNPVWLSFERLNWLWIQGGAFNTL